MYNNDEYLDKREQQSAQALMDWAGGTARTWVELTHQDGHCEVRIIPRYLAIILLDNLAAGCEPDVARAKMVELGGE